MGEFTTDLANKGNHEGSSGSWSERTKTGIVMEAEPKVGDRYNQEFAKGVAEDKGTVLGLNGTDLSPLRLFLKCAQNQGLFTIRT